MELQNIYSLTILLFYIELKVVTIEFHDNLMLEIFFVQLPVYPALHTSNNFNGLNSVTLLYLTQKRF